MSHQQTVKPEFRVILFPSNVGLPSVLHAIDRVEIESRDAGVVACIE